jgi:hypothetical protein
MSGEEPSASPTLWPFILQSERHAWPCWRMSGAKVQLTTFLGTWCRVSLDTQWALVYVWPTITCFLLPVPMPIGSHSGVYKIHHLG